MEIKNIKKGKKNTYIIELDTKEELICYDDIIVKYSLIPKHQITQEELNQIKKENSSQTSYYKALDYLTYRLRTKKEMESYLTTKGYEKEIISKTIERLQKEGYLNEKEYIKCFVRDAIHLSNDGPYKIKSKLIDLGCTKEEIELVLNHYQKEDWMPKLIKLYQKKINSKHNEGRDRWIEKCNHYFYLLGYPKNWLSEISNEIQYPEDHSIIKREYEKLKRKWQVKLSGKELIFKIKSKLYEKGFSKELIEEILEIEE